MCKYPDPLEPGRVAGRGVLLEGNDSKGVGSASSTSVTFMLDNYSESAVDCSLLLQYYSCNLWFLTDIGSFRLTPFACLTSSHRKKAASECTLVTT